MLSKISIFIHILYNEREVEYVFRGDRTYGEEQKESQSPQIQRCLAIDFAYFTLSSSIHWR